MVPLSSFSSSSALEIGDLGGGMELPTSPPPHSHPSPSPTASVPRTSLWHWGTPPWPCLLCQGEPPASRAALSEVPAPRSGGSPLQGLGGAPRSQRSSGGSRSCTHDFFIFAASQKQRLRLHPLGFAWLLFIAGEQKLCMALACGGLGELPTCFS